MVKEEIYVKSGKTYELSTTITDVASVYKRLAEDMIAKKINCCTYIKSIRRTQLYNGFERITVIYDNQVKSEYIIESR